MANGVGVGPSQGFLGRMRGQIPGIGTSALLGAPKRKKLLPGGKETPKSITGRSDAMPTMTPIGTIPTGTTSYNPQQASNRLRSFLGRDMTHDQITRGQQALGLTPGASSFTEQNIQDMLGLVGRHQPNLLVKPPSNMIGGGETGQPEMSVMPINTAPTFNSVNPVNTANPGFNPRMLGGMPNVNPEMLLKRPQTGLLWNAYNNLAGMKRSSFY